MANSRFQCLHVARQLNKSSGSLRAGFSTSKRAGADEQPRAPSASELLAGLDAPRSHSPSHDTIRENVPSLDQNPIRTPGRANPMNVQSLQSFFARSAAENRARTAQKQAARPTTTAEDLQNSQLAMGLSKQITRRWKAGDVYSPHDLSEVEMAKWRKRGRPDYDVFDALNLNPEEHYRNFSMMSEFMTPMGRIKHSSETGLRPVNQRRISRAIRRTIGMGMMPSVHRHPEILYKMAAKGGQNMVVRPTKVTPAK